MFAVFITVLCLMSVGHSAPLSCEQLIRPLDQLDTPKMEGRWALVASSPQHAATAENLRKRDSITIEVSNTTYIRANRIGNECQYHHRNISLKGDKVKMTAGNFTFIPTYYNTSCPDCLLLSMNITSQTYNSVDLFLLSKRRQLEKAEMDEFAAQVECLKMPPPVVMDPAKDLCPEEKTSGPEAQAEKAT